MTSSQLTSISTSLSECAQEIKDSLSQLTEQSFQQVFSYDLDCSILPEFSTGYTSCEKTDGFIKAIESESNHQYRGKPAVYWFEITSDHSTKEIYTSFVKQKKESKLDRSLPAYKKVLPKSELKVLYVGKVTQNLAGRMLAHTGYDKSSSAQGLQLCHWNNRKGLKLRLNVIYLPETLVSLTTLFEICLAKQLNPILGKHK